MIESFTELAHNICWCKAYTYMFDISEVNREVYMKRIWHQFSLNDVFLLPLASLQEIYGLIDLSQTMYCSYKNMLSKTKPTNKHDLLKEMQFRILLRTTQHYSKILQTATRHHFIAYMIKEAFICK